MDPEILTTISPTTHEAILTRKAATAEELSLLAKVSTEAFHGYRRTTTLEQRTAIVRKALDLLAARRDDLALELTVQMGRPIAYTGKEIDTAVKRANFLLGVAEEALKDTPGEEESGFRRWIVKEPVGPVLIIFAWNVSLHPFTAISGAGLTLTDDSTPT